MKAPLLKIPHLKKQYKRRVKLITALDISNFEIYPGEFLELAGESGSGKTTFGRCLLRLEKADRGAVIYQNENLLKMRAGKFRKMRPKFQMIFQDPSAALNPRHTMREALTEPLQLLGKLSGTHLENRLKPACTEVQLSPELLDRFPHELSSGQMQRVCIARALSMQPLLLIADEPTANLDALIKWQILDLLQNLQKKHGVTVLFITHDLAAVEGIANRTVVLEAGKIREITFANRADKSEEKSVAKENKSSKSINYS